MRFQKIGAGLAVGLLTAVAAPAPVQAAGTDERVPVLVAGTTEVGPGQDVRLLVPEKAPGAASGKSVMIARSTTLRDGSFTLGMGDLRSLRGRAKADGAVDVLLAVPTADGIEAVDVVLDLPASGPRETVILDAAPVVSRSGQRRAARGAPDGVITTSRGRLQFKSDGDDLARASATSRAAVPMDGEYWCNQTFVTKYVKRKTFIAGQYSTTTGAKVTATFERGNSSRLGVAVSTSGAAGTYKASGESSSSLASTTTFPASRSSRHNYAYFTFNKYKEVCQGDTIPRTTRYKIKAGAFEGGAVTAPATAPSVSSANCRKYQKGSTFTLNRNRAWKNSFGADLTAVGLNVSAETGYTTTAKLHYNIDLHSVNLCGTNTYPGNYPQRIVVKSAT